MKILFVPGFREDFETTFAGRDYPRLKKMLIEAGYEFEFVGIDWKHKTHRNYVDKLNSVYSKYDPKQIILAGFSFGATTALLAASKRPPSQVWLFSLSPYFQETKTELPKKWLKNIGINRSKVLLNTSLIETFTTLKTKTICWFGSDEIEEFYSQTGFMSTLEKLVGKSIYIVEGVGHDATDTKYIEAIRSKIIL